VSTQTLQPRHKFFSPFRVWAIASNTLLELIRQKVFYFLLIFALLIIGASFFLAYLRPELQFQSLKDVSFGAMSIFSWLLAVLATAMLLPKDIEDRTLYTILAKPVPRFEYLLGKLLGVFLLLAISILVMSVMFAVVLFIKQQVVLAGAYQGGRLTDPDLVQSVKAATFTWSLVQGVIAIYFKALIFATVTLLISTFASSWIFTIVVSVSVFLIGLMVPIARDYINTESCSGIVKGFFTLVPLLFPDLQLFDLTDDISAGNTIPMGLFLHTLGMGALYIMVYTWLSYFMFSKKEL